MNKITKRQNESEALIVLIASRYYYDMAAYIDIGIWLFLIMMPIVRYSFPGDYFYLMIIVWWFVSEYLNKKVKDYHEKGADFRTHFDYYVFGWAESLPSYMVKKSKRLKKKKIKYFTKEISNDGEGNKGGSLDWYQVNKEDTDEAAIYDALDGSVFFNENTNLTVLTILGVFTGTILLLHSVIFNELTVWLLIIDIAITYGVISKKLVHTLKNMVSIQRFNKAIEQKLERNEDLIDIHKMLTTKRYIAEPFGSAIYKIKRVILHKSFAN